MHFLPVETLFNDKLAMDQQTLLTAAADACSALSDFDRGLVFAYVSERGARGWSTRIAEQLEQPCSPNNLRVRVHRAVKKIKQKLSEAQGGIHEISTQELIGLVAASNESSGTGNRAFHVSNAEQDKRDSETTILITIEIQEEEFDARVREVIFDNFAYERISIAKSENESVEQVPAFRSRPAPR